MSKPTTFGGELWKQTRDQFAHGVWGAAAGALPWLLFRFAPSRVALVGAVVAAGSGWFWTRRERLQFADGARKPWDPMLDNTVYWACFMVSTMLGIVLNT